jgi:hypothetical protein
MLYTWMLLDEVVYPRLVLSCITCVSIFYCLAEGQMNGVRGLSVEPAGRLQCTERPVHGETRRTREHMKSSFAQESR